MKQYPSIDKNIINHIYIYAFDKLDGSNIRAEWNSKKGFYKFGTRHQLMDENTPVFGKAIPLIKEKYEESLGTIFKENKWRDVICFFEWYGPNSFAGQHLESDQKELTLIDVNPFKKGILGPQEFIELFGSQGIPRVLFEGYITEEFVDSVKNSSLEGMTCEGVVCKGIDKNQLSMFKIKSRLWLDKLKTYCAGNDALYNKLV